jgi:hypothetical protein
MAKEAAKPSETRHAISAKKLKDLLKDARAAQQDIDAIAGTLGESIKKAVEKNYLHRKAFNVVKSADRMEPAKLRDFLDCLDHYLDISGLRERAASAPSLPMGGDDQNENEADELEQARAKRDKPFPQPHGQAAE